MLEYVSGFYTLSLKKAKEIETYVINKLPGIEIERINFLVNFSSYR